VPHQPPPELQYNLCLAYNLQPQSTAVTTPISKSWLLLTSLGYTFFLLMSLDMFQVGFISVSRSKFCNLISTWPRGFLLLTRFFGFQARSVSLFCHFFIFLFFFTFYPFFRIDYKRKTESKWQSSCFKHLSSQADIVKSKIRTLFDRWSHMIFHTKIIFIR